MANPAAKQPSSEPMPQVGRPARINVQDIIAAAIDIGLEGVTLKQVAERLGVALPTLYRHVRNRDEAMRRARDKRDGGELPHLRQGVATYLD